MDLNYCDTATFYKVEGNGYNKKIVTSSSEVACLFSQSVGYGHSNNQDFADSDSICYPDPCNAFILANKLRLEGMYVLAPLFDASDDDGWYKITSVTVNKDLLLQNQVGNIELALKKTKKLDLVS